MSNATQSAMSGGGREQPGKPRTVFGGIDKSAVRATRDHPDFTAIQRSEEFRDLRRRVKWFVFPATALFLIWYVGYMVVGAYFPAFMARPLWGEINVGLAMGLGQFVTTVALTSAYVRFARRRIDPEVDQIRQDAGDTTP